jgi:hypothetical protein
VPALDPPAAPLAAADVDPELAHHRHARDVGLKLLGDFGLGEGAVAVGAGSGQPGVVALADLVRSRRRPMAVAAVGLAGLAAGRLGVGLGRPLGIRTANPVEGVWSLGRWPDMSAGVVAGCGRPGVPAWRRCDGVQA